MRRPRRLRPSQPRAPTAARPAFPPVTGDGDGASLDAPGESAAPAVLTSALGSPASATASSRGDNLPPPP